MKTPSPREQRLIALLILIAACAMAWIGIGQPIMEGFDQRREERAQLLLVHQRNQQAAAALPLLRAAARSQRTDAARFNLPATNAADADLRLREVIRAAAGRNEIVMKPSQSNPTRPGWASVRVDGVAGLDALGRFLADLQNGQPLVLVTSTNIAANKAFQTGAAAPMEIQLEVSAPYDASAIR